MRSPFEDLLEPEPAGDVLTEWCDVECGDVVSLAVPGGSARGYLPRHYEAGYQYPLIVWLRSSSRDGADMARWIPLISDRNYVALEVTGPMSTRFALGRSSWPDDRRLIPALNSAIEAGIATAFDHFSIHPDRVFVAGAGDVAGLALTAGLVLPQRFAGAAAIDSGPVCLMTLLREFRHMQGRRAFLGAAERKPSPRGHEELVDLLATAGVDVEAHDATDTQPPLDAIARRMNEWMMQVIHR